MACVVSGCGNSYCSRPEGVSFHKEKSLEHCLCHPVDYEMGERLRIRDARNNSNKCYSIFFDPGDEELMASPSRTKKMKNTRSPPKKKSRKTTIMTATQPWVVGETIASQERGKDTVNQATDALSNIVTTITTETQVPAASGSMNSNEREDTEERRIAKLEEVKWACNTIDARKDQDAESKNVGESPVGQKMTLHVVDCYDETGKGTVESESWQSNNNNKRKFSAYPQSNNAPMANMGNSETCCGGVSEMENCKKPRLISVKDEMFELFQVWALHTYGDQAKTKTITRRKKNRILKALDGKEHNNPDSSKFRFWVKSKGFTTHPSGNFSNFPVKYRGNMMVWKSNTTLSISAYKNKIFKDSSLSTSSQEVEKIKDNIDLYVASAVTDNGERVYRKVAVVEEFFDIIYNVHVDQGGRNGRHAGQKRTYRIITETYAFLPREAVTKFLSSCPSCKKNLRAFSPARFEDTLNDSSSDFEVFNYSSQNESSVDSTHLGPMWAVRRKPEVKASPLATSSYSETIDPTAIVTTCDRYLVNRIRSKDFTERPIIQTNEKTESNSVLRSKETNVLESSNLQKGFYSTENFETGNLSSTNTIEDSISLHDKISMDETLIDENKCRWAERLFDVGRNKRLSNCYEYLRNSYVNKSYYSGGNAESATFLGKRIKEEKESCVDLTIKQGSYININIDNNIKQSVSLNNTPVKMDPVTDYNINSVDVSINMSNTSNELKISCKTTPPRKRYSIFKDYDIDTAFLSGTSSKIRLGCDSLLRDGNSCTTDSKECRIGMHASKSNLPILMPPLPSESDPFHIDLSTVKPITSTYLRMTRSFGLTDAEALRIDDLESGPTPSADPILPELNAEDAYAGLMKDADKLKLMLLAWNYQNSNAIRNGSEAPDLSVVGGLWAQYQNALALNTKQPSVSPVNRTEQPSPIENQDETNSSGQKDEDDASEDDSDDKLDQNAHDPERLKAFNMFVRLFVDENLDRMIPISKQPKEKIQAIIDSCARQFPEFCERSRKRIRTYLKSCRRNKKTREGWDNSSRPTPAHLTSVQAEQILAIACENESMNAKRMRIGLDPISQSLPLASNTTVTTDVVAPSITYPGFRIAPSTTTAATSEVDSAQAPITTQNMVTSARSSPISLTTTMPPVSADSKMSGSSVNGCLVTSQIASPLYRPADFTSSSSTSSPYSSSVNRTATSYPAFFPTSTSASAATPTDLSMKQQPQPNTLQASQPLPILATSTATGSPVAATGRPPLLSHKLNPNEMSAVRQLITGYRESAAFLLRSADELEQLLLQQQ